MLTKRSFFKLDDSGKRGQDQKLFEKRFSLYVRKFVSVTE